MNTDKIEKEFKYKEFKNFDWNFYKSYKDVFFNEEMLELFKDKINWHFYFEYNPFLDSIIEKYNNYFDNDCWRYISSFKILSEEFIEKYKDKVDWSGISNSQTLSESFIEKYADRVDWEKISFKQILSEEFIEKFRDLIYWKNIALYQRLSEPFIKKYKNYLNKDFLKYNKNRYF